MKTTIVLICSLFIQYCLSAQTSKKITVKAGENAMDVLSKEIYQYPEFTNGTVFFRNEAPITARLNYNLLVGDVQFIHPNRDTLSIADENTIKFVTIGNDSFYYDQGYLKSIMVYPSVKLAMKVVIKVVDKQKIGAYGQPSSRTIESYSTYADAGYKYNLDIREDIILSKETSYYLGNKYNRFLYANKKNLLKMFPKQVRDIERFLREKDIDFNKEEDMKKLVGFLDGL